MSRPSKKRALMPLAEVEASITSPAVLSFSSSSSSSLSKRMSFGANLDAFIYKAELEHEKSLRVLDVKRAQQNEQRLEKLLEFSQDELEQCKKLLDEERQQSESMCDQLRLARDEATQQLRELKQQRQHSLRRHHRHKNYHDGENDNEDDDDYSSQSGDDDDADNNEMRQRDSLWQRKYNLLQSKLSSKDVELNQMRIQLRELQVQMEDTIQKKETVPTTPTTSALPAEGASSPAPADLLHELNRVRIALAESERQQRQIRRAAEEWQIKAKQLVPERETARSLQVRLLKLESQLKEMQKAYQISLAENEQWQTFGRNLAEHFPTEHESTKQISTPPEVTTILRHVEDSKNKLATVQETNRVLEERLEKLKDWKRPAEARIKSYDEKESAWKEERKELKQQLESQQHQLEILKKQEGIWKREIASLQELLQTFDRLPISTDPAITLGSTGGAKLQTVELDLKSTQEELQVVRADRDCLQQDLNSCMRERQEQRKEFDRVKEKYGKLREALELERGKAQEAEARAHRAEELAGMGSFNPHETRVLHLSKNPLNDTLRQQNASLKKQLQEALQRQGSGDAAGASKTTAATPQSEVDPEKLHQRLKQSFKEQIGHFREGVYLMTGYKIDMLPGVDRPTFRVRSMYAEREEDHLMLKWPKTDGAAPPTSLDLLNTEWAKALWHSPSYDYIKRFNSLPAFLASVQLAQFEKQTMM